MTRTTTDLLRGILLCCAMLAVGGCSTMELKEYPQATATQLHSAETRDGISIFAKAMLDEAESKAHFGVNLTETGILAVHLTIRNDNSQESFLVPADSVSITQQDDLKNRQNPEKGDQKTGEVVGVAGAILISPLLMAVAIQQLSDASVIEENFETKKLRTTTIDPGEQIAGFTYFNWEKVKTIESPRMCLKVVNPVANNSFPYCLDVDTGN